MTNGGKGSVDILFYGKGRLLYPFCVQKLKTNQRKEKEGKKGNLEERG